MMSTVVFFYTWILYRNSQKTDLEKIVIEQSILARKYGISLEMSMWVNVNSKYLGRPQLSVQAW